MSTSHGAARESAARPRHCRDVHAGAKVFEQLPGLEQRSRRQAGVLTRAQLAAYGVDSHAVAAQVVARRWATIGPVLVVMHRGPLTRSAHLWAAVLNAGPAAGLSAWTALQQWGLKGWDRELVHVVVPRGQTPAPLVGVQIHESRRHSIDDLLRPEGRPAAHDAPRAAIDAAAWEPSLRGGCGLLAAVVQQRLARPQALLEALGKAGRIRHRRVLAATLSDIIGGADALSEIDFVKFCAGANLPAPNRQSVRLDMHGRRRFRDVEWRRPDGRLVIGEIDGMGHMEAGRWYEDLMRDAELAPVEDHAIRFRLPAMAIHTEPARVEALLRRLLLP